MDRADRIVRLFLSVDIAGSTRLKDVKNHQTILRLYNEADLILRSLNDKELNATNRQEKIRNFVRSKLHSDEMHWADIIQQTFTDFHTTLQKNVADFYVQPDGIPFYPWKAIGDELVYAIEIKSRDEVHRYGCAFLRSIREIDKKLKKAGHIRLKGTAWIAGFPIRNREVTLPMPSVVLSETNVSYPYPALDFLGPDMDIGFRISKHAWPGLLTVSMDVATLLGEATTNTQMLIRHVGWDKMKGVWQDRPYPIFWARMPLSDDMDYSEYDENSVAESQYLKEWAAEEPTEAKVLLDKIDLIRKQLSGPLGLVKPYIISEGDEPPGEHELVHQIISDIGKDTQRVEQDISPQVQETLSDDSLYSVFEFAVKNHDPEFSIDDFKKLREAIRKIYAADPPDEAS